MNKHMPLVLSICILALFTAHQIAGGAAFLHAQQQNVQQIQDAKKNPEGPANNTTTGGDQTSANQQDEAKPEGQEEESSLWKWFKKGGIFMWPILFCAALGLGFIIERSIFFLRTKLASKEFIDQIEKSIAQDDLAEVEKICAESGNKMGQIILKGLSLKSLGYERVEKAMAVAGAVEVSLMERGLNVLTAVGNIAPMLGFLGTVSGMITAFYQIAAADQVSARIVASGIMEALITTETGLIVAIPTLLMYNYFVHRIDGFVSDVERIASDIIERMIKGKDFGKNHTA